MRCSPCFRFTVVGALCLGEKPHLPLFSLLREHGEVVLKWFETHRPHRRFLGNHVGNCAQPLGHTFSRT